MTDEVRNRFKNVNKHRESIHIYYTIYKLQKKWRKRMREKRNPKFERNYFCWVDAAKWSVRVKNRRNNEEDEYKNILKITSVAPNVKRMEGWKPKKWTEPKVASMIATEVAKFFAILSAYFMHIATDKPPIPYQITVDPTR